MKKTILAFALVAALASCGGGETVDSHEGENSMDQEVAAPAVQEEINQIDNVVKELNEASSQLDAAVEEL
ncbi:MAG: hypothetical protein P8H98_09870 [Flavobacteriales bacterium]|nr:hypothetical protein [Flavobacteriaceae bacterium]MDG1767093.1 hypothetical protein [Flavobacteriales bacterium]